MTSLGRISTRLTATLLLTAAGFLGSCASRNIHPELSSDTRILTRGWTYATRGLFDMNDRGYEYSSSVLYENTLIFGSVSEGVTALYPNLLRVRWRFPVQNGVVSEMTVEKKNLYFGGGDGFLYCLNADTGKLVWKYEVKQSLLSKPSAVNGRVFVTSPDDSVFAFDAGTGKWLWTYKRRTPQAATIHAASSPVVNGNEVIAGMSDGFLVALSLEEGQLKWERKLQITKKFTDVDASPVLQGETLYVPSYDGALYALKSVGGDTVWRFDAGGARKITLEGDVAYLPSSNGTFYALSTANGKVLWQFDLDRGVPTQAVITDRYVVFASSHQYLYVLDKASGRGLYRFNAGDGAGFSGNPTYAPAMQALYFLSMGGNLYQFNIRSSSAREPDVYRFDSAYRTARQSKAIGTGKQ